MCRRTFFMCVDENFPNMHSQQTYNTSTAPMVPGTEVFEFKNIFEDLSPTDTSYIEVTIPEGSKLLVKNKHLYLDRYTFISKTKLSSSSIQWLIDSGVNPIAGIGGKGLIYWAIENDNIGVLMYLLYGRRDMFKLFTSLINTFIAESKYDPIIRVLVEKGYDIHIDNDSLFLFAASNKTSSELCRFLLEHGANIPRQVKIMFSMNKGKYPLMESLIEEYSDRIV